MSTDARPEYQLPSLNSSLVQGRQTTPCLDRSRESVVAFAVRRSAATTPLVDNYLVLPPLTTGNGEVNKPHSVRIGFLVTTAGAL
jgi:hypothetical protein